MSYLNYFFNVYGAEEAAVCCPFPHAMPGTDLSYKESNPSAHINCSKGLFHCKSCGRGYNETQYIMETLQCAYSHALKIALPFKEGNNEDTQEWEAHTSLYADARQRLNAMGISNEVVNTLRIRSQDGAFVFPVFLHDKLMDIRTYSPGCIPKWKSREGCSVGHIVPYDLWRHSPKTRATILCAGEKDMAVARSQGFNAITITGGENMLPMYTSEFKDRDVILCYDNDYGGKTGAIRVANHLLQYCKSVKICLGFHEVCKQEKEDITDFFTKYMKTRQDLIQYLNASAPHEYTPLEVNRTAPIVDLVTASSPEFTGKTVRSNVQVVANIEGAFSCPSHLLAEKKKPLNERGDKMAEGDFKEWMLEPNTVQDILHFIDNNFDEDNIRKNYRQVLGIGPKESNVKIHAPQKVTVYKAYVTDLFETSDGDAIAMEYTAYSVQHKLESGRKYMVTHRLVPHPYRGQSLIMLITDAVQANDSVSNFKLTDDVKSTLATVRDMPGTVSEKMTDFAERFKEVLGYNGNNQLITTLDLAFHTPLEFNFGMFKRVRAYLDTIVVSESRVGKSTTAAAMRKLYQLGTTVSLAGNAATIPGLVGGSNKVGNSFQTRAGLIPQNHKGLLIFEELGKCDKNIIKELTDIRSSNEVRITRVSGTVNMPALLRMVYLSNVKATDGIIRPITSYPNGISILTDLVGTAEDIARYDIALILSDMAAAEIDPLWVPSSAHPEELYRTRIRWIWSRVAEQVQFADGIARYITEQANDLNKLYACHIKLFGTEAWKKLARLSIAVAGFLVSTDENFSDIIVKREHVEYAVQFLKDLYDNATFRLREYVEFERKFNEIDEAGVKAIEEVYQKCPGLILHLEQASSTTRSQLQAAAGMPTDAFNAQMNRLTSGLFITLTRFDVIPTQRFRKGVTQINRARALRIGEIA